MQPFDWLFAQRRHVSAIPSSYLVHYSTLFQHQQGAAVILCKLSTDNGSCPDHCT